MSKCRECYARGAACVDQDKVPVSLSRPVHASPKHDENKPQAYSLRERVARLEDFIETYLLKDHMADARNHLDQQPTESHPPAVLSNPKPTSHTRNTTAANADAVALGPTPSETTTPSTEQSPVLSLFNNHVFTQVETLTGPVETNPSFDPARFELLNLLPHEPDLNTLVHLSLEWWNLAPYRFPELLDCPNAGELKRELSEKFARPNPGETAKVLLWTLISAERLPRDVFQDATAIATLASRILPAIDRAVLFNDKVATTLPGIECLMSLSRYYCNLGQLRKAWHLSRRALEYSISAGLYCVSSKTSSNQSSRHLQVWQAACYRDRYLSMVLGLPYGVSDSYLYQPPESPASHSGQIAARFYSSVTSIIGQVIDRNQTSPADAIVVTLKIDHELESMVNGMDNHWWSLSSFDSYTRQENLERIEAYFIRHFIRAFLHLPFMLKFPGQGMSQFSYDATVESARQALVAYRLLRVDLGLDPYLCISSDFKAFVMLVLLVLHLLGQKNDPSPRYIADQNDKDWAVVDDIKSIFLQASKDERNTVAKQAIPVLEVLLRARGTEKGPCPYGFERGRWCKVTIPCFGEITVRPGKKMVGSGGCPYQTCTTSTPTIAAAAHLPVDQAPPAAVALDHSDAVPDSLGYDTVFMSLGNVVSLPHDDWRTDDTQFTGMLPEDSWTMPVATAGLSDLQQEWDLDFFGPP